MFVDQLCWSHFDQRYWWMLWQVRNMEVYVQGAPMKNNPPEKKCCNSATVVRIWALLLDFVQEYSRHLSC